MSDTKQMQDSKQTQYTLPKECCRKTVDCWKTKVSNNCIKFLTKQFSENQQKAIIDIDEELVAYDVDGDGDDGVLISNEFYTVRILLYDIEKKKKYIDIYSGGYQDCEWEPPLCYRQRQKVRRNTVKL